MAAAMCATFVSLALVRRHVPRSSAETDGIAAESER
jgi:hypothetical protein